MQNGNDTWAPAVGYKFWNPALPPKQPKTQERTSRTRAKRDFISRICIRLLQAEKGLELAGSLRRSSLRYNSTLSSGRKQKTGRPIISITPHKENPEKCRRVISANQNPFNKNIHQLHTARHAQKSPWHLLDIFTKTRTAVSSRFFIQRLPAHPLRLLWYYLERVQVFFFFFCFFLQRTQQINVFYRKKKKRFLQSSFLPQIQAARIFPKKNKTALPETPPFLSRPSPRASCSAGCLSPG